MITSVGWLVVATLVAASSGDAGDPRAAWATFVDRPTRRSYEQVALAIDACRDTTCERSVAPEAATVGRLVKLVDLGQPLAVDAAFRAYRLLDAEHREAVARALGRYAEVQPTRFLRTAHEYRLSPAQLKSIVRTFPRDVADDEASRREAMERRIQALSGVEEPELAAERVVALDALRSAPEARRQGRTPTASGTASGR